ncbi:MAG: ferrous iron transport protein A [Oscillospiraceae bacterium]|nr:ferrous iron transport protein A [Oscillospiraceae bacterium]
MNIKSLYQAEKRKSFKVVSVPDIELLRNIGLRTGTNVTVQTRYAFGGPVLLKVEDTYEVALGKDIANNIQVADVHAESAS